MAERTLASYRAVKQPQHTHGLEAFEAAVETVAQAQALRGDFLDREAKLRQAADLADAATNRADSVLYALDEKKRSVERAADTAAHARAQAREVLALLETRHAALLDATRSAHAARSSADEAQQAHHQLTSEVSAARLDLQQMLEEAASAREELQSLKALSRSFALDTPGLAPGLAPGDAPGSFAAVPTLYPAGPTLLSFLYGLITDSSTGAVQRTGSTMTGALSVDLSASSGPIVSLTGTYLPVSGLFGLIFDKAKTLNVNASGIGWKIGGAETWSMGQDFDTNNTDNGGTGNSDFIIANDRTANANAGADIMRFSPAEKDSIGSPKSCKMEYGGIAAGSPRDKTSLWTVTAGAGLGGINLNINSANAREHLTLVNAHATSKRATINYNDLWLVGPDMAGIGSDHGLTWRDKANSLNRLYLESSSALTVKMGVNTTGPLAYVHTQGSIDATYYDVIQTHFAGGAHVGLSNRTMQFQQIVDASQAVNYMWLMGTLGAGSTRVTPVTTSVGPIVHGIESTNLVMSLISAPTGTNQTINRVLGIGANALGFFDTTPVAKQAGASAAGIAAIADAPAKAAITALQAALAAYGLVTSPG